MMVVMVLLITLCLPMWPMIGKETIKMSAIYSVSSLILIAIITLLTKFRSVFAMIYCPMSVLVRALLSYMLARGVISVNSTNCN
jgi:hypothetical protein